MEKIATRSQKGIAGVHAHLISEVQKATKVKIERSIIGVSSEEVALRVFVKFILASDSHAFTQTGGKIYGGMVKRLYNIERIRSVYEGWQYVAFKLSIALCGDDSIQKIGDNKYGPWLLRDKSVEHVYEAKLIEQLEILTGRTFKK